MSQIIMWSTIGILVLFLLIGLFIGMIRGLKRSALHIVFMLASFVIALLITKPIVDMILQIKLPIDGEAITLSEYIVKMIQESLEISNFETVSEFIKNIPSAIAAPIVFLLVSLVIYFVCDIIYLISARISFGKKKKDFKKHKAHRLYGGLVGMVEAFLFMILLLAPLTSLTKTYQEIAQTPTTEVSAQADDMQTIGEILSDSIPKEVSEVVFAFNSSVIGKISGAVGLDNAMFDSLSRFSLNGEKINFREEIINLTDVYDEFVVVYNNVNASNYSKIDLSKIKANIEKFLDNGIFKTVVVNTIEDFVLEFDELNLAEAPELLKEIIKDLNQSFSREGFDAHKYIKEDILSLVDTVDILFKSGIIESYEAIEEKDMISVLEIIDLKSEEIEKISTNILSLNFVNDSFRAIGDFLSEELQKAFDEEKSYEIAINIEVDKESLSEQLLDVVEEFLAIGDYISFKDFAKSDDILSQIAKVDDVGGLISQVGKTLDKIRNLEILILPVEEGVSAEKVYVFDNILNSFDIKLLGDKYYKNINDLKPLTIENYSQLFDYIKNPIVKLKEYGLFNETIDFDNILNNVLIEIKTNKAVLSELLLPFYQLDETYIDTNSEKGNFKAMVFDSVIDTLEQNTNELLSFDKIKETNNLIVWNEEFEYICKALDDLNSGTVGQNQQTYLKYMLSADADLEEVISVMLDTDIDDQTDGVQTKFVEIMKTVFDARVFESLEQEMFDIIDSTIEDMTGVVKKTDKTILNQTQLEVLNTIESLLSKTLDIVDGQELELVEYGEIIDLLKVNAYNNGAKNGVFNNIFCNIICYLTGENLNGADITKIKENENREDIKQYINEKYKDLGVDKYYLIDYTAMMNDLQEVIDFAVALTEKLPDAVSITTVEGINEIVDAVNSALLKLTENEAETINNMVNLVTETAYNFIPEEEKTEENIENIKKAIEDNFDKDIADALINLFKLTAEA